VKVLFFSTVLFVTVNFVVFGQNSGLDLELDKLSPAAQFVQPGQENVELIRVNIISRYGDSIRIDKNNFSITGKNDGDAALRNIRLVECVYDNVLGEVFTFGNAARIDINGGYWTYFVRSATYKLVADIIPQAIPHTFTVSTEGHPMMVKAYNVRGQQVIEMTGFAISQPITIGSVTGISENASKFLLAQNYPNPFNPTTTVKFSLPSREKVSLKIFDALGREVKVLVNEMREAGEYQEIFDARDLSSGTYYYLLQAGQFKQTKKMTLLK